MVSPDSDSQLTNASDRTERSLPHRLRLLFVGPGEPPWALLALRLEADGCIQAEFDWECDPSAALARLRSTAFDGIIIRDESNHAAPAISVVEFINALRASGSDDPVVVLKAQPDDELAATLEAVDGDLLVTMAGWQSRALVATIRRAVAQGNMRREIVGREVSARRGRLRERDEAESHLEQLLGLVARLSSEDNGGSSPAHTPTRVEMIGRVEDRYQQLLRTYVMMGSGHLASDVARLVELLALADVSTIEAMSMHLRQVEAMLQGLGSRSSRHVLARADLLALDLMIQLGERYRQKPPVRGLCDEGIDLLHAESLLGRMTSGAANLDTLSND